MHTEKVVRMVRLKNVRELNARLDNEILRTWQAARDTGAARRRFDREVQLAGLTHEARPYPVSARPYLVTAASMRLVAEACEAAVDWADRVARLLHGTTYARQLKAAYGPAIFRGEAPGPRPAPYICRVDGMVAEDGSYRILEINTACPGGVMHTGTASRLWLEHSDRLLGEGREVTAGGQDIILDRACLQRHILAEYKRVTQSAASTAGVVNFGGRLSHEADAIRRGFEELGTDAQIIDAASLRYDGAKTLTGQGRGIDLLYSKIFPLDLADPGLGDFCNAAVHGKFMLFNPLVAQWHLESKATLAFLSDESLSADLLSPGERDLAREIVPWTRIVADRRTDDPSGDHVDLLDYIDANREHLVLKPCQSMRGDGICIGDNMSPSSWRNAIQDALNRPHVAQERVRPQCVVAARPQSGELRRMGTGLDCFIFGGYSVGLHARASETDVINIAKQGMLLPVACAPADMMR
jgi:hypothetical protein